ncbi:MAG: family of calcium-binding protein [Acidimicrobiales bacterium]|nr:family of calcium-binding protein [Acidimicrobiales bacterium]
MRAARSLAAGLACALAVAGAAVILPNPAAADGLTAVPITCTGIPVIGSTTATANVNATDDVDPVAPGGTVTNTINVPVPVTAPPVDVTVKEVKLTIAIPTGVTVTNVTFTSSSFTTQIWALNGTNLIVTLSGSVVIKSSGGAPSVPDITVTTTVAGPPRTVSWKVPSSIVAKGSTFLGNFTATCTANNADTTLLTTTVVGPNTAPTATDQAVSVNYQTAKAITLAGTDPESNPLTFALGALAPAHGALSGAPPSLTYTPVAGYSGPDSFTFTTSDGSLSDIGTVSITVGPRPNTAPTATDQAVGVAFQTPKAITLAGTDPQSDPLAFALGAVAPAHGTLTGTPPSLTYTPATGYVGTDAFTFTASDGLLSDVGTVTITVAAANNAPPTATDQAVAVTYQTAKAITLAGTDPESTPLTFALGAVAPAHGTLTGTAPNLTYTPAAGYVGLDSFTFTASDGLLSDAGTVSITVLATVPGAPSFAGPPVVQEGQATLSWTAPANTGGSALTGFVVTPFIGGLAQAAVAVPGGSTTSATLTGLSNGVTRTFKVAAVNGIGTGPPSSVSSPVTAQWWLPWSSGPAAVDQLFVWFTGKAPTASELSTWLGQLDGGTKRPGDLVAVLRVGPDATSNVDPTARLYSAYFVRIPDKSGLDHWVNKKRGGMKISQISTEFARSSEFVRRYGEMSNRKFVEQIYVNVQGRTGDPSGIDFWTGQLDRGNKNRGQVMVGFSESTEYKRTQADKLHAAIVAIDMDGKAPTVIERDAFVTALVGGSSLADVVRNLIHTDAVFIPRAN